MVSNFGFGETIQMPAWSFGNAWFEYHIDCRRQWKNLIVVTFEQLI